MSEPLRNLLSLPPAMAAWFMTNRRNGTWFASSDPAGSKLGSGGGVAQLLVDAWRFEGASSFSDWLTTRRSLVLLAGGQSRRLPAYGPCGKIFMPVPVMRWAVGHRLDQTLLDLQASDYGRVLQAAPKSARVLVTSGDVFLAFPRRFPAIPRADVVGFGIAVNPETAAHFGVFFSSREAPGPVEFFLQKPEPGRIRELAREHSFFVDTGLWLLSERAIDVLLRRCGWDGQGFEHGTAGFFELYAGLGPGLGARASDPELAALSTHVVPIANAGFYHFGTTRQMIESLSELQNRRTSDPAREEFWRKPHPDMYVLNSDFAFKTRDASNRLVWIENCALPDGFQVSERNALTGIPSGDWTFQMPPGLSLDFVPVGVSGWVVRPYGFDDSFSGKLAEARWMERPALEWFTARDIDPEGAGIDLNLDIQESPLFAEIAQPDSAWVSWLTAVEPDNLPTFRELWLTAKRFSARELGEAVDLTRLFGQRRELSTRASITFWDHRATNPFFRVDLENAASLYAASTAAEPIPTSDQTLDRVHELAFAAAVRRHRGKDGSALEREAFAGLADRIVGLSAARPVRPQRQLLDDQILWARSPIRLDLAGGWSDTAPFCLKHGGAVVNVAAELNGQAPVQVFVRACAERHLVVRSIDLGAETVIRSLTELENCAQVGSEFSLAKAAFCLAGFHPRFRPDSAATLADVLEDFGSGLEISMLAATPKGSGLGTSSVLAATLLAALASAGGVSWDHGEIVQRTLALEQLLTTGGGWQDQAGAIYHGIKLLETQPGFLQEPTVRWLPQDLFGPAHVNRTVLLYYTGLTRVAKTILQEIVRGMFLNSSRHLENLFAIREHARAAYHAIQCESSDDLGRVVARSWELNCALDSGTNPPEVAAILDRVADWTTGAKLLGAGGGGYVVFFAKDAAAGLRIREDLESRPPNARSRFVDFSVSPTGLQITRS